MTEMKFLFTLFLLLYFQSSFSQTLVISVKDENNKVVDDYSIFMNSSFVSISSGFVFYLSCKEYDTIHVKKDGFTSVSYVVQSDSDTLFKTFTLFDKIQELEEVSVTFEKYVKLAGEKNENIIDFCYFPESEMFLLLKSYEGNYFIEKKTDLSSNNYPLSFRPELLFLDALGNTHILSKDSTYQIWIQDTLNFVSKLPRNLFDSKLKPLISKNSNYVFYENYSEHNQFYVLSKTDKDNEISIVYDCFDKVAHDVAKVEYNEIINLYYQKTTPVNNIIKNGSWDGNVISLGEDWEIIKKIGWYLQVRSQPIECYSFGMLNCIVLINFHENNIQKFNQNGELINKSILEQTEIKNKELIYDYFYDAIYVYGLNKGTKEIYKLNIDDGKLVLAGNINQINPSHIKVVGKEIFFLSRNEAGFNKLFRMKME